MLAVSTIVTILVFFLPIIGALLGFKRGIARSALRLGTVAIAIALTLILTPVIAKSILDIEASTLGLDSSGTIQDYFINTLTSNETMKSLLDASPSLFDIIKAIPVVLLAEILFVFVFFIFKFLLWFVYTIISLVFFRAKRNPETGKKVKRTMLSRLIGTGIGFVQGVACMTILIVPFTGILSFTNATADVMRSDAFSEVEGVQSIVEMEDKYLSEIDESAGMKFVKAINLDKIAQSMFDSMSNVTIGEGENERNISLIRDIQDNILPSVVPLMKLTQMDMSNLNASSIEDIKNIIETIGSSEMATQVFTDVITDAAGKLKTEEGFMGISLVGVTNSDPDAEPDEVTQFVDGMLSSLENASPETVVKDMGVFVDVLGLVSEYEEANPPSADSDEPQKDKFELIAELAKEPEYNQKLIDIVNTEGSTFSQMTFGEGDQQKTAAQLLQEYMQAQQS